MKKIALLIALGTAAAPLAAMAQSTGYYSATSATSTTLSGTEQPAGVLTAPVINHFGPWSPPLAHLAG